MFYYIENKRYSKSSIKTKFNASGEYDFLIEKRIIEVRGEEIIFRFVGLIATRKTTFFVLPKYYRNGDLINENPELINFYIELLLKAEKYFSQDTYWKEAQKEYEISSICSLYLEILNNYAEYGLYNSTETIVSSEYSSRIDWNKTIETKPAIITGNSVFYPEVHSIRSNTNEKHIITEIQRQVLFIAYEAIGKYIKAYQLGDLYSPEIIESYDKSYLQRILQNKLNHSFADKDLILLKLLIRYLNEEPSSEQIEFSLLGTREFYHIWEIACKSLFRDEYEIHKNLIPRVKWELGDNTYFGAGKLIPDILFERGNKFYILDAKYYLPIFKDNNAIGVPQTESISKQIMYQNLIRKHKEQSEFINAFVFPDERKLGSFVILESFIPDFELGEVSYEDYDSKVKLWFLPPEQVFVNYLEGKGIFFSEEATSEI